MGGTEQRAETDVSLSYAEQVDLVVTTTDLQGLRMPIKLYDGVVQEARHKNVSRFTYWTKEVVDLIALPRYEHGRIKLEPFGRLSRETRRELAEEGEGLAAFHA